MGLTFWLVFVFSVVLGTMLTIVLSACVYLAVHSRSRVPAPYHVTNAKPLEVKRLELTRDVTDGTYR